ncbi:MAG: hypothetical protein K0B05_07100 [Bacteroidales bacterium]|nr:hypothetical protein [Bacteroidales bacterium]
MRESLLTGICCILLISQGCIRESVPWEGGNHIRPYTANPFYWQYKSKPVLLLGATGNDNLFQNENLLTHLDSLKASGGNYLRNTMSDRDPGNLHAFGLTSGGKYDLNTWNDQYWGRFESLLKLARERDIIVQIEIWDRFDHSRDPWITDPFNPANNVNYSFAETGLDSVYPLHPGSNVQPFFFSVPELDNNIILLEYQQKFVEKLLSTSLQYDNVLYCIDNETSGREEWAIYWVDFVRSVAGERDICVTQMWDNWDVKTATHKRTLDHPDRYGFIDISQNSQLAGPVNWSNAQYVFDYIKDKTRPVNSTKIYGSDSGSWLDRGINTEHAINTFFRNITGGFASSRFHRPPSGLGLSEISINCIKTVRDIEKITKMWDMEPSMHLLEVEEGGEAYLSAREGKCYILYFITDCKALLDLKKHDIKYRMISAEVEKAEWERNEPVRGGSVVELNGKKRSVIVLYK